VVISRLLRLIVWLFNRGFLVSTGTATIHSVSALEAELSSPPALRGIADHLIAPAGSADQDAAKGTHFNLSLLQLKEDQGVISIKNLVGSLHLSYSLGIW